MGDARAVGAQTRMRLPSLTPPEGKRAADILARKDNDAATALRSLAEGSRVSEAMVLKVTKKLGFGGFRKVRQGLVANCNSATARHRDVYGLRGSARIADVVLWSTAPNNPLPRENAAARITPLNLIVALFVAIAQRDRAAADQISLAGCAPRTPKERCKDNAP